MNKPKNPQVTVALPTYNRDEVVLNTIADLFKQSFQNFEIIVVDQSDNMTDDYRESIRMFSKDARFRYFHVTPANVTSARNFALAKARSDIIVYLDDDVKVKEDLVEQFVKTFESSPDISAIGGRVMQQGFPIMDKILMFNKYMISEGVFTSPMSGYTNAFAGGNCALKTKDALSVGGFDTRYRDNAFREESDMSMKMISNNMKIYYQPKAELLHLAAPRGGNRVTGDIWDSFGTYKNELFFTFRYVRLRNWIMALRIKIATYCTSEKPTVQRRRRRLFIMAIPFAFARFFLPQIKAKETKT